MTLHTFTFQAMATRNEILIYCDSYKIAKKAAKAAEEEVKRIERTYSRYRQDSVISAINRSAGKTPTKINNETYSLLNYADACYSQSNGLFDITSGVLRIAWDFRKEQLPSQRDIHSILPLVGWGNVEFNADEIYLPRDGMELDFGGIGKEYAADRAGIILKEHDITNGLVNLGGDVFAVGPQADGSPWKISIVHPRKKNTVIAQVPLFHGGLATSGDYERYILVNGKRYHHLLNPKTGWPSEMTFQSVSVISDCCIVSGSSSSIAMLFGITEGEKWLSSLGLFNFCITNYGEVTTY